MEIAALLAVGLNDWIDFGVIVGILLLNAFVGYYQEKQAADVVASLKGDIAMKTTVVRDGQESIILARELVPGDIVNIPQLPRFLEAGSAKLTSCLGYCSRRADHPCRLSIDLRLQQARRV